MQITPVIADLLHSTCSKDFIIQNLLGLVTPVGNSNNKWHLTAFDKAILYLLFEVRASSRSFNC